MEPHPVPQDINSFQFHLVGDMTIKQFAYLAGGLVIAYFTFILFSETLPLLAWPIIVISLVIGVSFAFIPISERPLDHWVFAFIRSIMSPTQRSWQHKDIDTKDPIFGQRLEYYMQSLPQAAYSSKNTLRMDITAQRAPTTQSMVTMQPVGFEPPPQHQTTPSSSTPNTAPSAAGPPTMPVNPPTLSAQQPQPVKTSSDELKKLVETAKDAQQIQNKIIETEHELQLIKAEATMPGVDPNLFAKRFQEVLQKLQELTKQANLVSAEISTISNRPMHPPSQVQVITPPKTPDNTQITLTTTANVINGIVTDALNNYLDGVIVVAHDKEGFPVRALKSNKLGQFIAATPLPNGTYTLTLEKDGLLFDVLKIEMDGTVLTPVRVAGRPNTGGTA